MYRTLSHTRVFSTPSFPVHCDGTVVLFYFIYFRLPFGIMSLYEREQIDTLIRMPSQYEAGGYGDLIKNPLFRLVVLLID